MVLNYGRLVGKEFANINYIYSAKDKLGLRRTMEQGQKTIAVLESIGLSTERIPSVEIEIKDYFAKDFIIISFRLSGHLQVFMETGDLREEYNPNLYQYYRNKIGRAITDKMREKLERLCSDTRMEELIEN